MNMRFFTLAAIFLAALTFSFCTDSDDPGLNADSGRLTVRLTDAPFPYELVDEANVTIFKVDARLAETDEPGDSQTGEAGESPAEEMAGPPYITLMEEEVQVNLLTLVNGVTRELAALDVPAGTYDLIRVYVKGVNVVLTDGTQYDLKVPSGAETGIKVFIRPGLVVTGGLSSDLLLDFDVSRSFVAKGNPETPAGINGFNFKPVVKASNMSVAGTLTGKVGTLEDDVVVGLEGAQLSIFAADTLNTTAFSDPDGHYAVMGLEAGTYSVVAELGGYLASDTVEVQIDAANVSRQDFVLEPETAEEETTTDGGS